MRQIFIGGDTAGGGLIAAVSLNARDMNVVYSVSNAFIPNARRSDAD